MKNDEIMDFYTWRPWTLYRRSQGFVYDCCWPPIKREMECTFLSRPHTTYYHSGGRNNGRSIIVRAIRRLQMEREENSQYIQLIKAACKDMGIDYVKHFYPDCEKPKINLLEIRESDVDGNIKKFIHSRRMENGKIPAGNTYEEQIFSFENTYVGLKKWGIKSERV